MTHAERGTEKAWKLYTNANTVLWTREPTRVCWDDRAVHMVPEKLW